MSTIELSVLILNPHVSLAQAAESQRPEVNIPDPVVDLLKADVFAHADRGDIDPAALPPDAPVGADVPTLEPVRVLQRRQAIRHRARRRGVARRRRLRVQPRMRSLVVELGAKTIEATLLRREISGRGACRLGLQGA